MTDSEDADEKREAEAPLKRKLQVSRRDVMKAAGVAGVVNGGFVGVTSAQDGCDVACQAGRGPANCSCALPASCEFISKTEVNAEECATVEVPEGTTHAVVKAGRDCIVYGDDAGETLNPGGTSEICIDEDCQGISHIEFYDCPCPYTDERLCVTEFSCCTVSGSVTNLDANCPVDVVLICDDSSEFGSVRLPANGSNEFSFSVDCDCTPAKVELRDPDGNVIDTEDHAGELTCSVTPDTCP